VTFTWTLRVSNAIWNKSYIYNTYFYQYIKQGMIEESIRVLEELKPSHIAKKKEARR
jgi:pentatricopeptide repeat protein